MKFFYAYFHKYSFFLEKYTKMKQEEKEKKEDWELILKKMEEAQMSNSEKEIFKREILHKDAELLREKYFFLFFYYIK